MESSPEICEWFRVPRSVFRDLSACVSAGNRHSRINVLLPEPLTPVTHTSRPSGNFTVRFCKLFFAASCKINVGPASCLSLTSLLLIEDGRETRPTLTGRRCPRVGYFLCARRHFPVSDSGCRSNSFNVPAATTSPPCTQIGRASCRERV